MRYKYLADTQFLKQFDLIRFKEQYVKITVLNWNEQPIQDITGLATGGSINLDGSSSMRRTANINVFASSTEANNITNIKHLLSLNKKVNIEIGFTNNTDKYPEYPIIWFPMGLYIIIQPNISHGINGTNISLQLKDKMCLLNGEVGGVLPASVTFSEIETIDSKGETVVIRPSMYQIIQEAVNHWGNEQLSKIIISDLDTRIKKVMKWIGNVPVYSYDEGNGLEFTTQEKKIQDLIAKGYIETKNPTEIKNKNCYMQYTNGRDIGYIYTDFIYPNGDLVGDAGTTVCAILDQIRDTLGNYEYFYDIDGNFHFQEIKNYLNTSKSTVDLTTMNNSDYLLDIGHGKSVYNFNDSTLITSQNNNPQYQMIKNDFIVWGMKKDINDKQWPIRYHLAIDNKPSINHQHQVFKYVDPKDKLTKAKSVRQIESIHELPVPGMPGIFYFTRGDAAVKTQNGSLLYTKDKQIINMQGAGNIYQWNTKTESYEIIPDAELTTITSKDWRTELYLEGVDAEPYSTDSNPYYVELQNEWPKLYDIWDADFHDNIKKTPSDCEFFLDFIDSNAAISEFSIANIGRRTKAIVDDKINCIFAPEIPDIIILQKEDKKLEEQRKECDARGQVYTQVDDSIYSCLAGGGHMNSAYEAVRDLLYQYTNYNESISLQTIPIYHLDVNSRISVTDPVSDISGDYIIHTISIPLDISGTMTISATRVLERF